MARKPRIVLDSSGIKELLNSSQVKEDVKKAAEDLKDKIKDFHDPEEEWNVEDSERTSRTVFLITNNDEELKWREMADPKIAKTVKKESRSGNNKKKKS